MSLSLSYLFLRLAIGVVGLRRIVFEILEVWWVLGFSGTQNHVIKGCMYVS